MNTFLIWFLTSNQNIRLPDGIIIKGPPVVSLLCFVLGIMSLAWIACDAERRGKSGVLAVLFALVAGWPISLLFWRGLRPPLRVPPPLPPFARF